LSKQTEEQKMGWAWERGYKQPKSTPHSTSVLGYIAPCKHTAAGAPENLGKRSCKVWKK